MAKKIRIQAELDDSKLKQQLNELGKTKEKITVDLDNTNINSTDQSMKRLNNTVSNSNSAFTKLKSAINNTFSSGKLAMTGYLAVLNEINKAGKNAKQTIQEIDKAITDLSIATNMSRESVSGLVKDYNNYAKDLKSTTTQITSAADDYLRAGKTMEESQALIKDSIMLSKLGKLDSGEATKDLLATMNGYEMSVDEVGKALDAMVAVDMEASTSAGDIATALKYCASSADAAGVSFNKLTGMIAQTQDKTMQSAETIGTFYNTLLSRYRDVKIGNYLTEDGEDISDYESVLKSVNVQLRDAEGEFRSFEVVLDELSGVWSTLSSTQQAAVIKVASGTRQQNRFVALMEGYAKALELTEVAANSAGMALDKFNNSYMDSLEAKQNALQASFESLVMNSDFSEVYAGILDATTALVDFINQTNALKGALTGLTVAGGIKGFLTIRTGINEAYISLNKFQNALDIVKKTNISTQEFDRLLLLSNGLSTSQMKLVLSTNALSVAQKKELLMASGLSEEEAVLQLQTWKMTTANTGLTASTVSLGNAFKGLWSTLVANPLVIVTALISGAVMAYQSYNQQLEETRQKNIESATTASENANKLKDLYSEYTSLASIQDRTTSEEEAFKTAVENITVALGNKAEVLKDLTVGTEEYAEALARATKEELQSQAVTATIGRKSAEEELQGKIWSDLKGSKVTIDSNSKGKKLSEEAQKAVDIVSDSLKEFETINRTWNNTSWAISSDDPTEALEYYNSLVEAREKLVLASENDGALLDTEIYEDLNTAINTMSESLDTYIEKLYEEEKLNYMAQNGIPSVTEEYKTMESALVGVAGSSVDLQDKFKELLMSDFSDLVTNVGGVSNAVNDVVEQIEKVNFDQAWADSFTSENDAVKELGNSLLELAEQGRLTIETFNNADSTGYFKDLGISADEAVSKINKLVDESKQLSSMSNQISSMSEALNTKLENGFVNADTLSGFDVEVRGLDSWDRFQEVLGSTASSYEECQEAANALATEWVNSSDFLAQLTEKNKEYYETQLQAMGVENYEEVIAYAQELNTAKGTLAQASFDVATATVNEIQSLIDTGTYSEIAQQQIWNLVLAKQAEEGITLDTSADCQNLLTLAQNAGATGDAITLLTQLLEIYNNLAAGTYGTNAQVINAVKNKAENLKNQINDIFTNGVKGNTTEIDNRIKVSPTTKSSAKSAGKDTGKSYKEGLEEELNDLNSVISGVTGRIDDQIGVIRSQKEAALEAIDAQIDALNEQKSALEAEKKALEDARDAAVEALEEERDLRIEVIEQQKKQLEENIKLIDKQIKDKEKVIKGIQAEIDAMQDANDERERELSLAKAKYDLERLQQQRTKLVN